MTTDRALMPDYLRLFALFGIVVVNVQFMAYPIEEGFVGATQQSPADAVAAWLWARGVRPGDRVAIMACTRYEWILLDAAIWAAGGVTVPIYPSSAPAQVEWIVQNSAAKLLIVEDEVAQDNLANADIAGAEVLVIDAGAVGALRRRGRV